MCRPSTYKSICDSRGATVHGRSNHQEGSVGGNAIFWWSTNERPEDGPVGNSKERGQRNSNQGCAEGGYNWSRGEPKVSIFLIIELMHGMCLIQVCERAVGSAWKGSSTSGIFSSYRGTVQNKYKNIQNFLNWTQIREVETTN